MSLLSKWGFNRRERAVICLLAAVLAVGVAVSKYKQSRLANDADTLTAEDSTAIRKLTERTRSIQSSLTVNSVIEPVSSEKEFRFPLNINTASAEALEELPGIGPALAERIIVYREAHGPFSAIDSLLNVRGIGPGKLKMIKNKIALKDTTTEE